jgi:predicted protein tyrosine phosphatase
MKIYRLAVKRIKRNKKKHKSHIGKMEGAYNPPNWSGKLDTRLTPVHRYVLEENFSTIVKQAEGEKMTNEQPPKPIVKIFSVQDFVRNIAMIKNAQANVISIRDTHESLAPNYKELYAKIDAAGFPNIYIATFDDLELGDRAKPNNIFPSMKETQSVLNWAKQKWNENHKPFVVHCTGGVSRSSAIGILIGKMLQGHYNDIFNPQFHNPNSTILDFGGEYLKDTNIKDEVRQKVLDYDKNNQFSL